MAHPWQLVFSAHARRRMFERHIGVDDVRQVTEMGEVIARYDDDKPYPSRLLLGYSGSLPLHVVVAEDATRKTLIVVSVYRPTLDLWEQDFRMRRR